MPFYISSCLFTNYVLYVCVPIRTHVPVLWLWLVLRALCSVLCAHASCSCTIPHFISRSLIICANKFNHLATYKSIYFNECDYFFNDMHANVIGSVDFVVCVISLCYISKLRLHMLQMFKLTIQVCTTTAQVQYHFSLYILRINNFAIAISFRWKCQK